MVGPPGRDGKAGPPVSESSSPLTRNNNNDRRLPMQGIPGNNGRDGHRGYPGPKASKCFQAISAFC